MLKKVVHLDQFESRCLDGIFLGYASRSRAFRMPSKLLRLVRFLLMKLYPAQSLSLSFQVMMKKAPPSLKMRKVQIMLVMQEPLGFCLPLWPLKASNCNKWMSNLLS